MHFPSLAAFIAEGTPLIAKGPVAAVFIEDGAEAESTLRHHLKLGFRAVLAFAPRAYAMPDDLDGPVTRIVYDVHAEDAVQIAMNALIDAAPKGTWLFYCYNAEYLFFPFCETRNVRELIAFHTEERRSAFLTYVVDLYAEDLNRFPDAVSPETAHLDRSGYYALARHDAEGHSLDRQLDFFGGLRWRFEEHVPASRRRIDRIALFQTKAGLRLRPNHTLSDEEMNTYACPWHHNITLALCSFRTAKALKTNPGSKYDIPTFNWHNSTPFRWHSQQLMDLGLMEPGQWF